MSKWPADMSPKLVAELEAELQAAREYRELPEVKARMEEMRRGVRFGDYSAVFRRALDPAPDAAPPAPAE